LSPGQLKKGRWAPVAERVAALRALAAAMSSDDGARRTFQLAGGCAMLAEILAGDTPPELKGAAPLFLCCTRSPMTRQQCKFSAVHVVNMSLFLLTATTRSLDNFLVARTETVAVKRRCDWYIPFSLCLSAGYIETIAYLLHWSCLCWPWPTEAVAEAAWHLARNPGAAAELAETEVVPALASMLLPAPPQASTAPPAARLPVLGTLVHLDGHSRRAVAFDGPSLSLIAEQLLVSGHDEDGPDAAQALLRCGLSGSPLHSAQHPSIFSEANCTNIALLSRGGKTAGWIIVVFAHVSWQKSRCNGGFRVF
jgi:hypothetical protein